MLDLCLATAWITIVSLYRFSLIITIQITCSNNDIHLLLEIIAYLLFLLISIDYYFNQLLFRVVIHSVVSV